ncbi:MAG: hypothetical protein K5770_10920 [Lachnospiraceae bacterium]|nr:hypothetical protein [Lachnospiraceae bacterium]
MEEKIMEQREALKELEKRLGERSVAARLSEDGAVLTVLLPEIIKGKDLFADILFYPQQEGMEGVSFASFRIELMEKTDVQEEKILSFCEKLSAVNNELLIGGYGLELPDGGLPFGRLVFSTVVPMIAGIRGECMTDMLENALTTVYGTLSDTLEAVLNE